MGKVTIVSSLGEGLYRVKVEFENARVASSLALITEELAKVNLELIDLAAQKSTAQADYNADMSALNSYISSTDPEIYTADPTTLNQLTAATYETRIKYDDVRKKENYAKLRKTSMELNKDYLQNYCPNDIEIDAWCVAYVEDLTGITGSIENDYAVKLSRNRETINDETGVWLPEEITVPDSQLQHPLATSQHANWFNLCTAPMAQRHKGRYRIATITSIDYVADTCSFTYEGQFNIFEHDAKIMPALPIIPQVPGTLTQSNTVTGANITYLTCNASSFITGDRVIVDMHNGVGNPTVIGFVSNPRFCSQISIAYCDNDDVLDSYVFKTKNIPDKTINYHVPGFINNRKTYGNKNYWFDELEKTCLSWDNSNVYIAGKTYTPSVGGRIITCSKYKNHYLIVSLYEDDPNYEFSLGFYSLYVFNTEFNITHYYVLPYGKRFTTFWGFLSDGITLIFTHHSEPSLLEQYLETLVMNDDMSGWIVNNVFTSTAMVREYTYYENGEVDTAHVVTPAEYIHDIFIYKSIVTCVVVNYHTWNTSGGIDIFGQADITAYSLINGTFSATSETNIYKWDENYTIIGGALNYSTIHYVMVDENNNIDCLLKTNIVYSTTYNVTTTFKHNGITEILIPYSITDRYTPEYLVQFETTTNNANQRYLYSQFAHSAGYFICCHGDVFSSENDDTVILDVKKDNYDTYDLRLDRVSIFDVYFKYLSLTK